MTSRADIRGDIRILERNSGQQLGRTSAHPHKLIGELLDGFRRNTIAVHRGVSRLVLFMATVNDAGAFNVAESTLSLVEMPEFDKDDPQIAYPDVTDVSSSPLIP